MRPLRDEVKIVFDPRICRFVKKHFAEIHTFGSNNRTFYVHLLRFNRFRPWNRILLVCLRRFGVLKSLKNDMFKKNELIDFVEHRKVETSERSRVLAFQLDL